VPSKLLTQTFIISACLAFSVPCLAASEDLLLYVGNSQGDDVSVVNLTSLKVVGDIPGGKHVHCVALTPDGRRLFTTSEVDHTLTISDTETHKILGTVKLPGKPNHCAVTPDGRYVTVPIRDGDSVAIVDVSQQKIVKLLPIKEPHNSLNMGSNRYMFVTSMGSHEIDVIDFEKMDYSAHIPEKKVTQRVEIPSEHPAPPRPREFETPDTTTHGLALSPDESEIWVTSLLDDCIYIYDLKAKKVTARLNTGDGPNWVVFSPDGKLACVSNTDSDDVSIFSAKERREMARVKVGKVPKRIAISSMPAGSTSQQAASHSTSN